MKKYILITLISLLFIITCTACGEQTEWIRVKMPYFITSDLEQGISYDFQVNILDFKVVDGINHGNDFKKNGSGISYISSKEEPLTLDRNLFSFYGTPTFISNAIIDIKINKQDKDKLIKTCTSVGNTTYSNNVIDFNNIVSLIPDPITGKDPQHGNNPLEDVPGFNIRADILQDIYEFGYAVNLSIEESKRNFLKDNPDVIIKAKSIVNGLNKTREKAAAINVWVYDNIKYTDFSKDPISNAGINKNCIEYAWEKKEGMCVSQAYVVKLMLDIVGIKNINDGGTLNGQPHMLSNFYDEEVSSFAYALPKGDVNEFKVCGVLSNETLKQYHEKRKSYGAPYYH